MKSPMPVMEQLWKTREAIYMIDAKENAKTQEEMLVPRHSIDKMLTSATFFNIQVAWDTYRLDSPMRPEDLGVLRLPYPQMWMEWQVSRDQYDRYGDTSQEEAKGMPSVNWAVVVSELSREDVASMEKWDAETRYMAPEANSRILVELFQTYPKWPTMVWYSVAVSAFDIDAQGRYVRDLIITTSEVDENMVDQIRVASHITGHALTLINCKNVTTDDKHRITFSRSGTEKRRGIPARKIKYHTIVLPGGGSTWDRKTGRHRAAALHRVRGHTKTFTADKPLMGKHVGTYWWGWQVRGSADNGIVVSDYEMGEKR